MNVTINRPGNMKAVPEHANTGRTLVYAESDGDSHAVALWISPAVAAQWIEALTPIAEAKS